jgi:hypothetical protein
MTTEQKLNWLANATADELLKQYVSLQATDHFGCNSEDIKLTYNEIIRRMTAK